MPATTPAASTGLFRRSNEAENVCRTPRLDKRAPFGRPQGPRWTRNQIRAARLTPIVPLLQKRGLQLIERPAGNFELADFRGLLVKDSYWRWPERNLAGSALHPPQYWPGTRSLRLETFGAVYDDAAPSIIATEDGATSLSRQFVYPSTTLCFTSQALDAPNQPPGVVAV